MVEVGASGCRSSVLEGARLEWTFVGGSGKGWHKAVTWVITQTRFPRHSVCLQMERA